MVSYLLSGEGVVERTSRGEMAGLSNKGEVVLKRGYAKLEVT